MKSVEIVVAMTQNRVIGKDSSLPWHIPEDMKHFKNLTMGETVVMGRKTWESLPEKFRPLPNRKNIVITRNPEYVADGAIVYTSVEEAIKSNNGKIFIIGGAQIYNETIEYANKMHITIIKEPYSGDVYFPEYNSYQWTLISETDTSLCIFKTLSRE